MNKHLRFKLLQRNAITAIKELEKRDKILEKEEPLFSSRELEATKRDVIKNRGCIPCSSSVRSRNAFDGSRLASGRTRFHTIAGELVSPNPFTMRIMKS